MKKVLLVIVALFCVSTVSAKKTAQDYVDIAKNSRCSVGLRLGTGGEIAAECFYAKDVYVEGRLGLHWGGGLNFTALHAWNPFDWNWTPNAGWWFFDYGVGAFVGGGNHHVNFGVAGMAKFGILFKKVPIRLSVDVTPHVGLYAVGKKYRGDSAGIGFYRTGLLNTGLSATWCF